MKLISINVGQFITLLDDGEQLGAYILIEPSI